MKEQTIVTIDAFKVGQKQLMEVIENKLHDGWYIVQMCNCAQLLVIVFEKE